MNCKQLQQQLCVNHVLYVQMRNVKMESDLEKSEKFALAHEGE